MVMKVLHDCIAFRYEHILAQTWLREQQPNVALISSVTGEALSL